MPKDGSYTVYRAAARIVSSYVSHNELADEHIPLLIGFVFKAMILVGGRETFHYGLVEEDHILCLEDGKKYRSLTRHLRAAYGMSPEEYRQKWGLPDDHPMTAPGYSRLRSQIARRTDFGNYER